jgi:hypothetical protein
MRDNRIIGHRICKKCDEEFGYTAYTRGRDLCRNCTYAEAQAKEQRGRGVPENFVHHRTEGYPNYIVAYLEETTEPVSEARIIPNYEIGVKRGLIGTHKQLGAM